MSKRKITKVIVAGVGGTLGAPVIGHLLAKGFEITALTSKPDKVEEAYGAKVQARKADYTSVDTLASSLQNCEALVILLNRDAIDAHIQLVDAAAAARVPHIIPSCFGQDTSLEEWKGNPALKGKLKAEEHVVKLAQEGRFTFTGIQTGLFFDWALRGNFILNCKGDGPTMLFDGGHVKLSTTALDDIGIAVANALLEVEKTKNRFLQVHSAAITQNQLLEYGRQARPEWKWQTIHIDSEALYKKSKAAFERGETGRDVMRGFLAWPSFGQGIGLFRKPENTLLGVQEWSDQRIAQLVSEIIDEVGVVEKK